MKNEYSGVFGFTVNNEIVVNDILKNKTLQHSLTGISSILRYESYNLNRESPLHNWLHMLTFLMDNRGEIVSGNLTIFYYTADNQVSNIPNDRKLNNIRFVKYPLKSKNKELHDEIFIDKKLNFADKNSSSKPMDNNPKGGFYTKLAAYLEEASIYNRSHDVSYIFSAMDVNNDNNKDNIQNASPYIAVSNFPLLDAIKSKPFEVFNSLFGIAGYILDDVYGAIKFYESLKGYRGPVLLGKLEVKKTSQGSIIKDDVEDYPDNISVDLELLGSDLSKKNINKQKPKK